MNSAGGELYLPAGFRFFPTDHELAKHYLLPKCAGLPIPVPIIAELDLYKFDPWQLPDMALYGEMEWYFFSPRGRKYPNGSRPNRSAGCGYWKATGADKPVGSPTVAIKKSLVFYLGKATKGEKTNWIMHEYRLAGADRSPHKKSSALRLDDWVLCRIYNKKGAHDMQTGLRSRELKSEVTSSPETTSSVSDTMFGYSSFGSREPNPALIGEEDGAVAGRENVPRPEAKNTQARLGGDWAWTWEEAVGFGELDIGFGPISPVFHNSGQDPFMFVQESI